MKASNFILIVSVSICSSLVSFFVFQNFSYQEAIEIQSREVPIQLAKNPLPIPTPTPIVAVDFTSAAQATTPAVVHVKTSTIQSASPGNSNPLYHFFGDDWFWGHGNKSQPKVGAGSGVIVSADGYIITNNHVIKDAGKIEVVLNDKSSYQASVVGTDPSTDLALLKIAETNLPALKYSNSDQVKVGEWVLAVGNPFNLESTVTAGIVSAKGRNINILNDNYAIE